MKRIVVFLAAFTSVAAFAQKAPLPVTIAYKCDDGKRLLVEYLQDAGVAGSDRATLTRGLERWKLSRQPAADGERYTDTKQTVEFWSRGPSATFTALPSGKAVGCRELPRKTK